MTKHAHIELIGLAVANLDAIPDVLRRAELLEAAGELLDAANCPLRAEKARSAAAFLRAAEETQQGFARLFTGKTDSAE